MPLASDRTWLKTYGGLPWWRVKSVKVYSKDKPTTQVSVIESKIDLLKLAQAIVVEHPDWDAEQVKAELKKRLTGKQYDFDPDQARDEDGKWTEGGGSGVGSEEKGVGKNWQDSHLLLINSDRIEAAYKSFGRYSSDRRDQLFNELTQDKTYHEFEKLVGGHIGTPRGASSPLLGTMGKTQLGKRYFDKLADHAIKRIAYTQWRMSEGGKIQSIVLYRGIGKVEDVKQVLQTRYPVESWTSSLRIAKQYAGKKGIVVAMKVPIKNILLSAYSSGNLNAGGDKEVLVSAKGLKVKKQYDFDPNQARDDSGKWMDGGGSNTESDEHDYADIPDLPRDLTQYERKVDFVAIRTNLDALEAQSKQRIRAILAQGRDKLIALITRKLNGKELTTKLVNDLELRGLGQLVPTLREVLGAAFRMGGKDAQAELKRQKAKDYQVRHTLEGLPPEKALEFFESKASLWGAQLRDPILSDAKAVLYDAIKQGLPLRDVQQALSDVFLPWLGDPDQAIDEKLLTPYRLETMVRTNTIEALNEGRKAMFAPEVESGFIIGMQYSAILDARTTEVCHYLDQKIMRPGSPEEDRLSPPRHYNCRSLWTPITRDEGPVQYITPSEVAKGIELSGRGFCGDHASRDYDFNPDQARDESGKWTAVEGAGAAVSDEYQVGGRAFVGGDGQVITDRDALDRIKALHIPPQWTGVEVSDNPNSALQATGIDSKGRQQYLYSTKATGERAAAKFQRVAELSKVYPKLVRGVEQDLAKGKEEAVVTGLILATAMRVGSDADTQANVKAYGATTLEARHLTVTGDIVKFDFIGKKGMAWQGTITDPTLASAIGSRLVGKSGSDKVFSVSAGQVNGYLKGYGKCSAKDLRTLIGTSVAQRALKSAPPPTTKTEAKKLVANVAKQVSSTLRNTPSVAKSAYINPIVWAPIEHKFGITVLKAA
jgi:DNA topoisomerase-1